MSVEPLFISENDEIKTFRIEKTPILLNKYTKNHINLGFELLKKILFKRYCSCSVSTFVKDVNSNINEVDKISQIIIDIFTESKSTKNTQQTTLYIFKNLLKTISISDSFINRLNINKSNVYSKFDPVLILHRKYNILPDDNNVKQRLILWIDIIKNNSNNKSSQTIKSIINYIHSCLPHINMNLDSWDEKSLIVNQNIVKKICKNIKQYNWFKLFCIYILNIPFEYNKDFTSNSSNDWDEYYSGDKHIIPTDELDLIYNQAVKSSIFDQLMFLMFITTGMRVGGFVRIKLNHICTISNNDITILPNGRTLEKGNKWFEFPINPTVNNLLKIWISTFRKGNSDYLFPSSVTFTNYIATNTVRNRFKKLCILASLSGKHLHLHSLRHSYAHILLKCGNNISDISKLLNHSNTHTTEQFYLKESISEVVNRANIPWLDPNNKPHEKIIPDFLNNNINSRNNKIERKLKRLDSINNILKFS
jgi:integrase